MKLKSSVLALALAVASGIQAQPDNATTVRPARQGPAIKNSTPVTLNFVNADIEAVTRAMGAMLDRQFVIDPRVKGVITVYAEQPVSVREAYLNYLAALRGLGFTVVENAGLLKVLPEPDAKLQAGAVAIEPTTVKGDQILTQIYRLQHENANNLVAVLRPLISPNNTINANPGNNTLVITDYADNLQRIARIIAAIDTPGAGDVELVTLKHAVASDLAPIIQRLTDGGGAGGVPGQGGASVSVLVDPRSNGLILRASNPARLAATRAMIDKLDQPSSDAGNQIRVVHLKNADAVKLATVLRAAFGAQSSGAGGSGGSPGGLTGATTANQPNALPGGLAGNNNQSQAATSPVGQSAGPSTGGNVQADPSTNTLIITAAEPLYRQMRAVIEQLDTRRAQVYVEAIIVKVDATKSAQLGVQWQSVFGSSGANAVQGVAGTNSSLTGGNVLDLLAGVALGGEKGGATLRGGLAPGLNFGLARKINGVYSLGAIANFLESQSGTNILSAPNLVALDNEEAKIVVGQNVPFVTGSFSNTGAGTAGANPFQTVERKDVGLVLRVKSQIGEGNVIRMVVTTENSSVASNTTSGPITDKSEIQTSVAIDDGGILILGGLMKDEYGDGQDAVPGLSKIPVLGYLFRNDKRERKKSNLMVILRPTVLRNGDDTAQFMLDRYAQIRAKQEQAQPAAHPVLPDTGAPVLPERPQSK